MNELLEPYEPIVGRAVLDSLYSLGKNLSGKKIVNVNSTRTGGGVAEMLERLVPLECALGLEVRWEVIEGDAPFFSVTKSFHNAIQGLPIPLTPEMIRIYEETNQRNAERLRPILEEADFVIVHDPQPAGLIAFCPRRKGKWVWRCHIDSSSPEKSFWAYLSGIISAYDASIFSLKEFAQPLPHPEYIVQPCIDPLSEKNRPLPEEEIASARRTFGLSSTLPVVLQVSRFDRFKDPIGVIEACLLASKKHPLQLVLAGGSAADDPEGKEVLREVREKAKNNPSICILELPPDAHRTINALQRFADVVLQKSIREGFGLTVTEALWKGKPVIGGNVGGIRLQIRDGWNGYLVDSVQEAASRICDLLENPDKAKRFGKNGREYVREHFLITRLIRDELEIASKLLAVNEGNRL